jgi:hypothetical protein
MRKEGGRTIAIAALAIWNCVPASLDACRSFAIEIAFRMDNRRQPLIISADTHDGLGAFGWKLADAASLQAMATRQDAARHHVAE